MPLAPKTKRTLVTTALLAPSGLWLFVFLVLPFVAMVVFSFGERAPAGGYQPAFTLTQYANLPARAAAYWNTLILAPVGAFVCLLVAYPAAYYLAVKAELGLSSGSLVVFDTGGGSSQFTFGRGEEVSERFSVNLGAVRITEQFGLDRAVSPETLEGALAEVSKGLSALDGRPAPDALVGMGGAVTNITAVPRAASRSASPPSPASATTSDSHSGR